MKHIDFVKMSASGNDFIIIDNRKSALSGLPYGLSQFARKLCKRKESLGADGILLIEGSDTCDFKMRIFNPDGTEVEACGNGTICCAIWAKRNNVITNNQLKIETLSGDLEVELIYGAPKLSRLQRLPEKFLRQYQGARFRMANPEDLRLNFELKTDKGAYLLHCVKIGVPHTVLLVEDLENLDIKEIGSHIRYHPSFQPQGTNVDFVKIVDKKNVKLRTYERGVEDETLSCGTGVVASSIISALLKKVNSPVNVSTRGGGVLKTYFNLKENLINDIYLEGKAEVVYEGRYVIK